MHVLPKNHMCMIYQATTSSHLVDVSLNNKKFCVALVSLAKSDLKVVFIDFVQCYGYSCSKSTSDSAMSNLSFSLKFLPRVVFFGATAVATPRKGLNGSLCSDAKTCASRHASLLTLWRKLEHAWVIKAAGTRTAAQHTYATHFLSCHSSRVRLLTSSLQLLLGQVLNGALILFCSFLALLVCFS